MILIKNHINGLITSKKYPIKIDGIFKKI